MSYHQESIDSKYQKSLGEILRDCELDSVNNYSNFDYYEEPITTISKILGCFEDDFRIPVLGFGARLWPLHCIVSHCFGLNSDIFHPLFDSVDEIKTELRDIMRKKRILPRGPVVFSEVLRFARDFAKFCKENDSRYYVVLVIMTDKEVSDVELFKEELRASYEYPLSVIVCRIVPFKKISSTFNTMHSIKRHNWNDEEEAVNQHAFDKRKNSGKDINGSKEADLLEVYRNMSSKLKKEGRDILHAFCLGEKQKLELTSTARKVFQKLPKQFVEYMEREQKKPKLQEEAGTSGRIKELKKELINKMANRKKNLDRENSLINR